MEPARWLEYKKYAELPPDVYCCDLTPDGEPILVARARIGEDLVPGYAINGIGFFVVEGECVIKEGNFSLLQGVNFHLQTTRIAPPSTFVSAGWSERENRHLHVGAMFVSGILYPGELRGGICSVAVNGRVYSDCRNYVVVAYTRMF
ncbi:Hypothetical predicted protein [Cloeon dipterum]|uniref:DUF3421 domain-containing protein n=1 Tax=Cloeon dipterum TaxID=197152 RepID=A0A8S1D6C2_9INSE|nr:Hypothetical predicted protein [Cloeon dipterum]